MIFGGARNIQLFNLALFPPISREDYSELSLQRGMDNSSSISFVWASSSSRALLTYYYHARKNIDRRIIFEDGEAVRWVNYEKPLNFLQILIFL
jgi:hypothetical protein